MIRMLPFLIIGCAKDDGAASAIEGSISLPDHAESASINWNKAFYAESGNAMLAFITGVDGASCSTIGDFLSSSDGITEKEGIYDGGGCVMTVKVNDWSGRYETSWSPSSSSLSRWFSPHRICRSHRSAAASPPPSGRGWRARISTT